MACKIELTENNFKDLKKIYEVEEFDKDMNFNEFVNLTIKEYIKCY